MTFNSLRLYKTLKKEIVVNHKLCSKNSYRKIVLMWDASTWFAGFFCGEKMTTVNFKNRRCARGDSEIRRQNGEWAR